MGACSQGARLSATPYNSRSLLSAHPQLLQESRTLMQSLACGFTSVVGSVPHAQVHLRKELVGHLLTSVGLTGWEKETPRCGAGSTAILVTTSFHHLPSLP